MKTKIYTPIFFLANKDMVLRINTNTIIGRSKGDIVLEDDPMLSTIHCELIPTLMDITIRDLNSFNGVFVNKNKIAPDLATKINVGDVIQLGGTEYILYDNENEVKKLKPPRERRRHPRPKNLYGYENLLNFYSAPILFKSVYALTIALAIGSVFYNIHLDTPVPPHLEFLSTLYSDQILFSGLKMIFMIWLISFVHSFFLNIYFNRNPVREGIFLVVYFLILFKSVDLVNGPLGEVKRYITYRQSIETFKPDSKEKAIIRLKTITDYQDYITNAYKFTQKRISKDEKEVLTKDYRKLMNKLEKEIDKLGSNKKTARK